MIKRTHKLSILGLAGVSPTDSLFAKHWEKKLQMPMIFLSVCSIPAIYLEFIATEVYLNTIGWWLNLVIFIGFAFELCWLTYLSHYKTEYLLSNWLNLFIIVLTGVSLTGLDGEWITLVRLLRLGSATFLIARMFHTMRRLYTPNSIPHLFLLAITTMTIGGAGFYWLEPTVHTYPEALWLAFITGATVGYGDFLPTTNASRLFAVLIVMLGYSVISLIIANISASFVGDEDKKFRKKLQVEVAELRQEVMNLNQQLEQQREHHERLKRIEILLLDQQDSSTNKVQSIHHRRS